MMFKNYIVLIVLSLLSVHLTSQIFNFNDNWQFQRLENQVTQSVIENQGKSWESQYNVTHTAINAELKVQHDTLLSEFKQLQRGEWEEVTLPHSPKIEDLIVLHQWQGVCYYKKNIEFNPKWNDNQIWLEFEGAMHLADIWINGEHIAQHAGGYTPFVVDVSQFLSTNKTNEVLVRLDNRDNPLIPPGKPLIKLDFCYYGGIYRNVNMILKPKDIYISHPVKANQIAGGGVFVTFSDVSDKSVKVKVKSHIINSSLIDKNLTVRQRLFEINGLFGKGKKGKQVAKTEERILLKSGGDIHELQEFQVFNPRLWSTEEPNLYLLQTEILIGNKIADKQTTRIGIRHIEFTKEKGFYLNGKPLRLIGSNRHMEYPFVGNALSDNAQYRDIYQIKESGFNIVRLGHYPQTKSVLDACDELGLLAIEPMPGWQFFNKNQFFIDLTYRDIQDMIRRDRNHPSVVLWETTLNESWPPNSWKDEAIKTAHDEYPGDQCFTSGDGYGYDGFDIVYNDWNEGFQRPNPGTKAGFIREYYDYEFGGHYSTTRIGRRNGESALLQNAWNAQWSHNRYRKQYPWTAGDAVWSMYDYNRGCCDNICESGVADLFRLPKFSLNFFKSQTSVGTPLPSGEMKPFLFIANYWARTNSKNDTVVVFGNVDETELRINGRTIARQKPDSGADTEYIPKTNGGNCNQLNHAPFTFRNIKMEKGNLEAVGYIKGEAVISQKINTPEVATHLEIEYFESGKKAGKNDLLIVYVKVMDKNGMLCVENNEKISLFCSGGNKIVGQDLTTPEAGIASFIIQTGNAKSLCIKAKSSIGSAVKRYKLID